MTAVRFITLKATRVNKKSTTVTFVLKDY